MSQQKTNPATAALVFASLLGAALAPPPASEITNGPQGQQTVTTQTQRTDSGTQGQRAPATQVQQQFADDPNKTLFHTRRNIMRRLRRYMEKQGLIKGPRQWRKLLAQARRNLRDEQYRAILDAD